MHSSFSIGTKFISPIQTLSAQLDLFVSVMRRNNFVTKKSRTLIFTLQKSKILERFEDVSLNDLDDMF